MLVKLKLKRALRLLHLLDIHGLSGSFHSIQFNSMGSLGCQLPFFLPFAFISLYKSEQSEIILWKANELLSILRIRRMFRAGAEVATGRNGHKSIDYLFMACERCTARCLTDSIVYCVHIPVYTTSTHTAGGCECWWAISVLYWVENVKCITREIHNFDVIDSQRTDFGVACEWMGLEGWSWQCIGGSVVIS